MGWLDMLILFFVVLLKFLYSMIISAIFLMLK